MESETQVTNGERIIQSIERWLTEGPLGDKLRADAYRRLISCGFDPPLEDLHGNPLRGADIGTIKTSCAVFARAILHDSGVLLAQRRGRSGQGMWHGWLGELSPRHRAWVPFEPGTVPPPGALFYIEAPTNPNNNHVGWFVQPVLGMNWRTAEGGGGDGTRCAYTMRSVERIQRSRNLIGWFDPELIGTATAPPPEPLEDTKPDCPVPTPTLRRGMQGESVTVWQRQLRADGWLVKDDGVFGTQTDAATRGWQAARGLEPDGVVGPKTRAAIGTPPKRSPSGTMKAVKP